MLRVIGLAGRRWPDLGGRRSWGGGVVLSKRSAAVGAELRTGW